MRTRLLPPFPAALALLALAALLAACSSGDDTLAQVEPDVVPEFPTYEQARAVLQRSCVPCHGAENGDDEDDEDDEEDKPLGMASDDVDLETCEGIQDNLAEALVAIHEKSMPPGAWPRLDADEVLLLDRWALNSRSCSPCTTPCPEEAP